MAEINPLKQVHLDELKFRLRSQQLFLTHLELRFEKLLAQLVPLPGAIQAQERQLKAALYEAHHLRQQVQNFEAVEEEYLVLLQGTQEELSQAQQAQRYYEQELEQWLQSHESQASDHRDAAVHAQDMGRSLARIVTERNSLQQQYEALEQAHQALHAQCLQYQQQLQAQTEALAEKPLSEAFLRRLHYTLACETAAALGQPLRAAQKHELAKTLGLSLRQQQLLDQQPLQGRIARALGQAVPGPALVAAHAQAEIHGVLPSAWVSVPAGDYPMGDAMHPAERPEHRVHLAAFQLARFPVTNAAFAEFMAAGGYQQQKLWLHEGWEYCQERQWQAPAFWGEATYRSGLDFPQDPVVGVSWYEADAFARWAGARLPTEPEWEAAARGLDGRCWPWGDTWQQDVANTAEAGHLTTTPVGAYPEGATPEGLLDMVGNVFEWTASLYQPYPYIVSYHEDAPQSSLERSLRGCSFHHKGSYFSRAAYRFHGAPHLRQSDIGFRLAQS